MPLPGRLRRRTTSPTTPAIHVNVSMKSPEHTAPAPRARGRFGAGRIVLISMAALFIGTMLVVAAGFSIVASLGKSSTGQPAAHIAVVDLRGEISANGASIARLARPLERAFDSPAKAVVIRINSPGGTPVQSAMIHDYIVRLKAQYKKPVVALGEDMLTSGAYMVAVAADRIVANRSTLVGSIGVVSQQFGFVDAMEKLGIEDRTQTAGQSKARLSPFAPSRPEDREKLRSTLSEIHDHFIELVLAGRGDRLKGDPEELFSGDFWTGEKAIEHGLADGLGDLRTVMDEFNVKEVVEYAPRSNFLERLTSGMATSLGQALVSETHEVLAAPGLR